MNRLFSVWLLAVALLPGYAIAADPVHLPDWLVGKWKVTEIYEEDGAAYQHEASGSPEYEPKLWYANKILDVSSDRLLMALPRGPRPLGVRASEFPEDINNELCTDSTVTKEETGKRQQLLREWLGGAFLSRVHFPRRPEPVSSLKIACGGNVRSHSLGGWLIIRADADTIETSFYGHGYLVLRRVKPKS